MEVCIWLDRRTRQSRSASMAAIRWLRFEVEPVARISTAPQLPVPGWSAPIRGSGGQQVCCWLQAQSPGNPEGVGQVTYVSNHM